MANGPLSTFADFAVRPLLAPARWSPFHGRRSCVPWKLRTGDGQTLYVTKLDRKSESGSSEPKR